MTKLEMETKRADQLGINCKWLIEKIEEISYALCPDKIGTWQQRAEWAALKAKELGTAHNSAMDEIALFEDIYELLCGVGLHKKDRVIAKVNARIVQLRQWGVDVGYFSRELDALKKSLPNRTPVELHRYLLRLAAIVEPAQAQATADNTGSPKLPPCACCEERASLGYYLENGYNFCPFCGRQLRAGA
jgi:hypothetical protein